MKRLPLTVVPALVSLSFTAAAQAPAPSQSAPPAITTSSSADVPPPAPSPLPPPVYAYPTASWMSSLPPPKTLRYRENQEPPPGYEVQTRSNKILVIVGGATFGAVWVGSIATALTFGVIDSTQNICLGLSECPPTKPKHEAWPLAIPLAGPWIAMGTLHPNSDGVLALVGLGIGQAGGLTTMIIGLASTKKVWARVGSKGHIRPLVAPGGVGVAGAF